MDGRGRQSAASLSVVASGLPQRLEPQQGLTPDQQAMWREIVATKPVDWFGADSAPLLTEYVRAVDMGNRLAFAIEAAMAGEAEEGVSLKDLLKMRDTEARRTLSLATKMRLAQQSRYTDKSAGTAANRAAKTGSPWQYGKA
ncbi:MAG: hypothetical protein WKF61_04800 [Luteimonas sp.]